MLMARSADADGLPESPFLDCATPDRKENTSSDETIIILLQQVTAKIIEWSPNKKQASSVLSCGFTTGQIFRSYTVAQCSILRNSKNHNRWDEIYVFAYYSELTANSHLEFSCT